MASTFDADIYRDFIIEAGEILEKVGEELVALDRAPGDPELLNSIFRGFHTIKGGAGFLGVESIVALCHGAEDIFARCRSGTLQIDPNGIDVVLRAVDALAGALHDLRDGIAVRSAPPGLLDALGRYGDGNSQRAVSAPVLSEEPVIKPQDAVLRPSPPAGGASSNVISDDEFEALLDQLHGKRKPVSRAPLARPPAPVTAAPGFRSDTAPLARTTKSVTPEKPVRQPEATLRIETRRLDDIMNLVGELVLARNRLLSMESLAREETAAKTIDDIDLLISDLQVAVMKSRMQPIHNIFARFPRVVRDLARSLGKDVVLQISGEETDLEKNMVEALTDPLVHLVRNAVDHGIETPVEREATGKPRQGTLQLSAHQEGDRVVVTIADDGAGIDIERLREAVVRKELLDAAAASRLTERECIELMFRPGVTTRAEASSVSGRGVGMDVVRTRIEQLGGSVEVRSQRGAGTTIVIRLPLTLAILPTLMVGLDRQVFAVPLSCVVEILRVASGDVRVVDGQAIIIVRGKPLPVFYLDTWLLRHAREHAGDEMQVLIVRVGPRLIAFVVDSLIGQEEVVIKPLGALVRGTPGLAGATITGDGRIALILDVSELLTTYALPKAAGA